MSLNSAPFLRWLHLTDLHIGNNVETQRIAMQSLVRAIENHSGGRPFDLVILTGDLVYSGKRAEFDSLINTLITPLRDLELCKDALFVAVPGNHDLDCDISCPLNWSGIGQSRQDIFFNLDSKGQQVRQGRASAFAEYSEFVQRANITSVDPLKVPAELKIIEIRERKFALITLVTCYFSDKEVKDYQKAPMPVQPIRAVLQDRAVNLANTIVLGHHPSNWFLSDTDRRFGSLMYEENALYLHGHEHLVTPKFSGRGLTSLGFGAVYPGSLDSSAKTYYRNSFAICELDDHLHVQVISWDGENGVWKPEQHLPVDFSDDSERLEGGYKLKLPTTVIGSQTMSPLGQLASAVKGEVRIDRVIWVANNEVQRWTDILTLMGNLTIGSESYKLPAQVLASGHVQFRVRDSRGSYLVHAVAANGDMLNPEQLKNINTELDTRDYDGCFVSTMGALGRDAKTLADQLSVRKNLRVFERTEIVKALLRSLNAGQRQALTTSDPQLTDVSLVITDNGLALLFEDATRQEWFTIVGESGHVLTESDSLVRQLRETIPSLLRMQFISSTIGSNSEEQVCVPIVVFDRDEYLSKSHAHFDDVRYAPLAALGLKFKSGSLSEMYVAASADVGGSTKTSQNATRALTELLESLRLPAAHREQLEAQMRARYGLERTVEVGAATQLYQRYNNIVVLGDPGSGKTCFLKHEILSYCLGKEDEGWYSGHLPVYVSLADAARLSSEGEDMLGICEKQSVRRGIDLPRVVIEEELARGTVAFFFDGLDEVGHIDKRIGLMAEIGRLVKSYSKYGNRFVIASRPAAVQPVDVPDVFTYVQLKGLTESEMRVLASRVLTARLGEVSEEPLEKDESDLVERLLADTKNNSGIARIAKNPLLLTLLVLIYANTGALSAKRHVIYTQAIKTLVSVRGREYRENPISEADLRTRLGAVAVAIFSREIDEIPRREDVARILASAMSQRGGNAIEGINKFLQEVAEATGLLSIHSQGEQPSEDDLITFMHFSFLEYYAAAGLIARGHTTVLTRLCRNPRWKDVTTLMFGILSDYRDITMDIKTLLHEDSQADRITQHRLLLALDCASECDVPPEGAQELLAEAIVTCISNGAGRFSGELRESLASKIQAFMTNSGRRVEMALEKGLAHENPLVVAAFCHLIAAMDQDVTVSTNVRSAFVNALKLDHPSVNSAAMLAIEKHCELRDEEAQNAVGRALNGNLTERHSALKVLCAVPEYQGLYTQKVQDLLNDTNPLISELAANSVLLNGLRSGSWSDPESPSDFAIRERVLVKLSQSDQESPIAVSGVTLDNAVVEQLLASTSAAANELAVRYVALVKDEAAYVHRTLSRTMRTSSNSRIIAACMDSFRSATDAITLFNIADTDFVCRLIDHKERNVRLSALKLMGELPDDEQVVETLREVLRAPDAVRERRNEAAEAAKALAKHVRRNPKLKAEILELVLSFIPAIDSSFGDDNHQEHIRTMLFVCESIGGTNQQAAQKMLALGENYKVPDRIRRQAIRAFGRLADATLPNVQTLCILLDKNDFKLKEAIYPSVTSFIKRMSGKVEYVRRIYRSLESLKTSLEKAWVRETSASLESIDPIAPRDIRAAIIEIENLTAAYEEFAERATSAPMLK
ncbi:metallophosphoesterase [Massilia oculi]|uniref:Metallophosphoesterase n=1 Tax=Massilia hydrophila TaxID=3044279 RepID=A0ABS7YAA9_9BURK|nr:metallophosphoesterase [Massilia oculi]MCA1856631.1 metallophosphoesterase [Massilia oculi]